MLNAEAIADNLHRVQREVADHAGARADVVTLIAVAKTFPAEAVRAAASAGAKHIGENYVQEAEEKIKACADLPLTWHFIGRMQKNKTARIAQLFDWVHSVDRLSFAERLSVARSEEDAPLNVLLQVNISQEESKGGAAVEEVAPLVQQIAALPNLHLRGLMALPAAEADSARQAAVFHRLADVQREVATATGVALDCLSMGMSGDYPQALRAGATHIRIGSAIFGQRDYQKAQQTEQGGPS